MINITAINLLAKSGKPIDLRGKEINNVVWCFHEMGTIFLQETNIKRFANLNLIIIANDKSTSKNCQTFISFNFQVLIDQSKMM